MSSNPFAVENDEAAEIQADTEHDARHAAIAKSKQRMLNELKDPTKYTSLNEYKRKRWIADIEEFLARG